MMQTYLVGGAVRDRLLGFEPTEHDWLVVGATPEKMIAQGFRQVGADFPVFLHPVTAEEYALARTERKSGQGYHGFNVYAAPDVTLEEDLLRRDLTINAMVMTPQGVLIDPYGGQQDLAQKQLRHVSDAFSEDPLRVLRVARFAARFAPLGFVVAPETMALMRQMVLSGELSYLTPERVWAETVKAMHASKPSVYFQVLRETGALAVLLPEVDRLFSVPQSPKHHPEGDAGIHTMMVLDVMHQVDHGVDVLWAALCHDVGKGVTPEALWPSHPDHEIQGVPLVSSMGKRYKVPAAVQDLALLVTRWHGDIHRIGDLTPEACLTLMNACDVWRKPERFERLLLVCVADSRGRLGYEQDDYPQYEEWQALLSAVRSLSIESVIASGVTGKEIGLRIQEMRLTKLTEAYKTLHN